jgi:hypothetical protein
MMKKKHGGLNNKKIKFKFKKKMKIVQMMNPKLLKMFMKIVIKKRVKMMKK